MIIIFLIGVSHGKNIKGLTNVEVDHVLRLFQHIHPSKFRPDFEELLCLTLLKNSGDHPVVYLAKLAQKMCAAGTLDQIENFASEICKP
jgi:hypothetical protein